MKKTLNMRVLSLILCCASLFMLVSCGKEVEEDTSFTTPDLPEYSIKATAGGSINLPAEFVMPTDAGRVAVGYTGSEMFGGFKYITSRGTEYFTTSGTITVTMNANLKKLVNEEYVDVKTDADYSSIAVALFKKDGDYTQYITTASFPADDTTYQATFSGLDAAGEYRLMFSYTDYPRVRATGTFTATGVTTAPTPVVEEDESTAASKKA